MPTICEYLDEIKRLTEISERQSECLAQALFEKNALQKEIDRLKNGRDKSAYWFPDPDETLENLKIAQVDLRMAQEQLRKIRCNALAFFDSLGVRP